MADNDTPNRAANKDKAEGERWKSEEGVIPNSASDPVPTGEDVGNRHPRGHDTPRRYEERLEEHEQSSDDPARR